MSVGRGDLKTLADGLFPCGHDNPTSPRGRDEVRAAMEVILKLWDYQSAKLELALRELDGAGAEIDRLNKKAAPTKEGGP